MQTETVSVTQARSGAREAGGQSLGSVVVIAVERHKHDGVLYLPGQSYAMAAHRVPANVAAGLIMEPGATPVRWWDAPGRVIAAETGSDVAPHATRQGLGALRIVQGVGYDPGSAAFRHHSAVNETTHHASAFIRWGHSNPHCDLRQYDGDADLATVRELVRDADVLHCHVNYMLLANTGMRPRAEQLVIRHYHGSRPGGKTWLERHLDEAHRAVVLGARLSHVAEWDQIQWLPIPMPVARYAALRRPQGTSRTARFRIAHSPTKREYKGTGVLLAVIDRLQRRGMPVDAVLIERQQIRDALAMKATCDAVFDSFWLGIQGSGLEGAAMGLPVIAGDPDVALLYKQHVGHVPYTYAQDELQLQRQIERLAMDADYRASEAERVMAYVAAYHDYAAVAARYEQMLATALKRPEILTPKGEPVIHPDRPKPKTPKPAKPTTQRPRPTVKR